MLANGYWEESRWAESGIYTFAGGTIVEFISFDKFGKAHGPRRDVLFINEANNIPYNIADQLITRTRGIVWLDWNPSEEFWFYTDMLIHRTDIDFLGDGYLGALTYKDNEALDEVTIAEIESHKNNKSWWQVYGEGKLGTIEARIYKDWQIIDEIPHEARLERRGIDFGYTNDPTVIVDLYSYNGGWIIDELTYQKGLSNKSIADIILATEAPQVLTIADSAEPKSIEEIRSYGINIIGAAKGKDSVSQGIQFVQNQRISITKRSVGTIKAYRNYMFLEDKNGKIINTPDDSVHEWSNCLIGSTKVKMANGRTKLIKNIEIGDVVVTENGKNKVIASWLDAKNEPVYEIRLSNGSKLVGTGQHKIYTKGGKVPIDALRYGDIIKTIFDKDVSKWKSKLSTTAKRTTETVNTILDICQETEKNERQSYCIGRYGNNITETYQKDFTFTMLTEILGTTDYLILNLKRLLSIYLSIQKHYGKKRAIEKKCKLILKILGKLQKNGIHQLKELNGIVSMQKKAGKAVKRLIKSAKFVQKNMEHFSLTEANFAVTLVRRRRLGKEDVYNLTIENEHNYYANGILVGNSMDAVRYGLNRPMAKKNSINEYKSSAEIYANTGGVLNPLTHQIEADKKINDYTGQVEDYINIK